MKIKATRCHQPLKKKYPTQGNDNMNRLMEMITTKRDREKKQEKHHLQSKKKKKLFLSEKN